MTTTVLNPLTAQDMAIALNGKRTGDSWMACCPAHDDHTPSLHISTGQNGNVLVHCHAGCEQQTVIDCLMQRGLWPSGQQYGPTIKRVGSTIQKATIQNDQAARIERALKIWNDSVPIGGTIAEAYLKSRGLKPPQSEALRFHPEQKHRNGECWPCMIGLVTNPLDGSASGIHRTFLERDGAAKAPIDPPKMMLGLCRGGVVCLAEPQGSLLVGEGIETCLSVMQATGISAWAALSTSGLKALDLPITVCDITILADLDQSGEAAARSSAQRWLQEGRRVRIACPIIGKDFNDMLTVKVAQT